MAIGPKRSGKGTIARVLTALVGETNTVNPRLAGLATNFGLAPLIGKSVAIIGDARLSKRTDQAPVVESMVSISGEDDQTIDRKHLSAWTGKLLTRFVLISNELPMLQDASGALVSRMIILRFTQSYFGREDKRLFDRLVAELPGILHWAIQGWDRLRNRGHFLQPASGRELVEEMEALSSPILAFKKECCDLGPGLNETPKNLFEGWKEWCQRNGRDHTGNVQSFCRDLHAAVPTLTMRQPRKGDERPRVYEGIRLKEKPTSEQKPISELASWLKGQIESGTDQIRVLVGLAGQARFLTPKPGGQGFDAKPLWKAADELGLMKDGEEGGKRWTLPNTSF